MAKTKQKITQQELDGGEVEVTPLTLRVYNTVELGAYAGVDSSRIRQLALQGRFPGAAKIGRDWIIPREDAEQWLEADRDRRRKPAEDVGFTD